MFPLVMTLSSTHVNLGIGIIHYCCVVLLYHQLAIFHNVFVDISLYFVQTVYHVSFLI